MFHLCFCLFQSLNGRNRAAKLFSILLKRDDKLVPVFCQALVDTDQKHVAKMLGHQGLYEFVLLETFLCSICLRLKPVVEMICELEIKGGKSKYCENGKVTMR